MTKNPPIFDKHMAPSAPLQVSNGGSQGSAQDVINALQNLQFGDLATARKRVEGGMQGSNTVPVQNDLSWELEGYVQGHRGAFVRPTIRDMGAFDIPRKKMVGDNFEGGYKEYPVEQVPDGTILSIGEDNRFVRVRVADGGTASDPRTGETWEKPKMWLSAQDANAQNNVYARYFETYFPEEGELVQAGRFSKQQYLEHQEKFGEKQTITIPLEEIRKEFETSDIDRYRQRAMAAKLDTDAPNQVYSVPAKNDTYQLSFTSDGELLSAKKEIHVVGRTGKLTSAGQSAAGTTPDQAHLDQAATVWKVQEDGSIAQDKWVMMGGVVFDPKEKWPVPKFNPVDADPSKAVLKYAMSWLYQDPAMKRDIAPDRHIVNDWTHDERKERAGQLIEKWAEVDANTTLSKKEKIELFESAYVKPIWEDSHNAPNSLINCGALARNIGASKPERVNEKGEFETVTHGARIRETTPVARRKVYLHSTGEKTISPLGGANAVGGNRPAYAKWDNNYYMDADLYEIYNDYMKEGSNEWKAAKRTVSATYNREIGAVQEDDALPNMAARITTAFGERYYDIGKSSLLQGAKSFTAGATKWGGAAAIATGVAVTVATGGAPLLAAAAAGIAGIVAGGFGGITEFKQTSELRYQKLYEYEKRADTPINRAYQERVNMKDPLGIEALKEDFGFMWRGVRMKTFMKHETRDEIYKTQVEGERSVIASAILAGTAVAAVGAMVLSGGAVAAALGYGAAALGGLATVAFGSGTYKQWEAEVANKGFYHWHNDFFERAGKVMEKNKDVYQVRDPGTDKYNRVRGWELDRDMPMVTRFREAVNQKSQALDAELGIDSTFHMDKARVTDLAREKQREWNRENTSLSKQANQDVSHSSSREDMSSFADKERSRLAKSRERAELSVV